MKILIDATPAEFAELIFILADVEVDDDEEEDDGEDRLDKVQAINAIANILDLYAKEKTT